MMKCDGWRKWYDMFFICLVYGYRFFRYKEEIYKFEKLAAQCAKLSTSETKLYNHEVSDSNPIIFTKMDDKQYGKPTEHTFQIM